MVTTSKKRNKEKHTKTSLSQKRVFCHCHDSGNDGNADHRKKHSAKTFSISLFLVSFNDETTQIHSLLRNEKTKSNAKNRYKTKKA